MSEINKVRPSNNLEGVILIAGIFCVSAVLAYVMVKNGISS